MLGVMEITFSYQMMEADLFKPSLKMFAGLIKKTIIEDVTPRK